MAGLLSATCTSLFFQMNCDVYYAKDKQNDYGQMEKKWEFDMIEPCSFYTLGDRSNDNNFTFSPESYDRFFRLETMLYGRVKTDIRQASDGLFYPLSHILISNIRGATCNTEIFFVETNGDYEGTPTIFEVKTCQPFVGPFNTIEYYKIQLERSDTQVMRDNAICAI